MVTIRKVSYTMEELLPGRLRLARAERGLTLRQAAKLTGVAKETLSDLERGRRSPHTPTLYKIAQGYEIPVRELLWIDEPSEELASPKVLAPPSPERAEESDEERREDLSWQTAKIQTLVTKHTTEFRELHRAGDEDGLEALLFEVSCLCAGLVYDLEDEEAVEDRANVSDEWHLAKYEFLNALMKLEELFDDIQAALQNSQAIDRVGRVQHKRAKSA
jgi:transcriptional regulator with XRE-family HTH domain